MVPITLYSRPIFDWPMEAQDTQKFPRKISHLIYSKMSLSMSVLKGAAIFFFVTLLCNVNYVSSFQLHRNVCVGSSGVLISQHYRQQQQPLTIQFSENPNSPRDEEIVGAGDSYEGSVDWDAEWKKVVENRDQPEKRPGEYKSPAEIAAIKATNKVAKNVFDASQEMKSKMPEAPSMRSLQGDWRFWIGILVIVSFGLSILSATSTQQVNDSFYI